MHSEVFCIHVLYQQRSHVSRVTVLTSQQQQLVHSYELLHLELDASSASPMIHTLKVTAILTHYLWCTLTHFIWCTLTHFL
jgi:hypothetical protein